VQGWQIDLVNGSIYDTIQNQISEVPLINFVNREFLPSINEKLMIIM